MGWRDQITLIALSEPSERTNEHGFPTRKPETATTVFADKKSVGYSEFYKAEMAGHAAEIKFDVYAMEYSGETIAEYPVSSGKRYRILRTYIHDDGELVELTLSSFPEAQSAANAAEARRREAAEMARFNVVGLDDLQEQMLQRAKIAEEAVPEMLKAGGSGNAGSTAGGNPNNVPEPPKHRRSCRVDRCFQNQGAGQREDG